jgi:archaemetzincin
LDLGTSERVLRLVDLDLYVPDLNFVFGLADPPGRRAVIALPRLRQSFYGK